MQNINTDVLVIGGGGAGAMAAYEASKHGVKVSMVLKGYPQRSGATIMAPGAIAGVGDWHLPGDSRNLHFQDTVKGGSFFNEQTMVRVMVEESPDLILELERMGALFQREGDGDQYSLRIDGGHSFARCPFLEDRTGREMVRAMYGELDKRHIEIIPNTIVLKLLKEEGQVVGALGLNMERSEIMLIKAKAIILACGGAGTVYQNTDNPTDVTGDGYALALEIGAELMDMEFVQFFPIGFLYPDSLRGVLGGLLYYLHLRNNLGERFMEKYDPERLELSTRDRVARAIFNEVIAGRGGPHGGVFADMTYHKPGFISRIQPALYETYRKIGINPEKDYLEIAPTCHFFMGGIKVDEHWRTSVPGLFAAGENAAGIHGANRLSQNALAEILVSGSRAGRSAADFASKEKHVPIDPHVTKSVKDVVEPLFNRQEGVPTQELRRQLRKLMWEKVGVVRTEEKLREALSELKVLEANLERQMFGLKTHQFNQGLIESLENRFLLIVARCITEASLLRTESRGAHYRNDYPEQDNNNWLKHLVISDEKGELQINTVSVDLKEMKPEGVC